LKGALNSLENKPKQVGAGTPMEVDFVIILEVQE
jgi:hypothetical protein